MPPSIAVAACARVPDLDEDWPLLRAALADRGVEAVTAVWTDDAVDWASFDQVLIRGTWDYFGRIEEFGAWVMGVSASTQLVNPPAVVAWNQDKRYLTDLETDEIPVVATSFVIPGSYSDRWQPPEGEFVVKPAVSAGGFETARYRACDRGEAANHVRRLLDAGITVMVQPYVASVDREGEAALVYLGGRYSHAVNKGPLLLAGAGIDDRLWARERIAAMEPSTAQRDVAEAALAAAAGRTGGVIPSYARVDLFTGTGGTPVISELELIEPGLFLRFAPNSVARFAEVLCSLL